MQIALDFGVSNELALLRDRLRRIFGPHALAAAQRRDPLSQLLHSFLSARTRDEVAGAAYRALRAHFPDWAALAAAEPAAILPAISAVTFPEAKAQRLPGLLRMVRARSGRFDLSFLADWDVDTGLRWLETLPGVGRKIAAATLNFSSMNRPALVFDSHLLRVLARLDLIPQHSNARAAYDHLMPALCAWTGDELYELHWLMKRLGQLVCTHEAPRCAMCPLASRCPSAMTARRPSAARTAHLSFV